MPIKDFANLAPYKGLYKAMNHIAVQTVTKAAATPGPQGLSGLVAEKYPIVFREGTNTVYRPATADAGRIKGRL